MQRKDMHSGLEVAVGSRSGYTKYKIVRTGMPGRYSSRRNDGVQVEALEEHGSVKVGQLRLLSSRDIAMPWDQAEPIRKERDERARVTKEKQDAAVARVQALINKIHTMIGADPMVELRPGRELGRTPANARIFQDPGERIAMDTAAVEELVARLETHDG